MNKHYKSKYFFLVVAIISLVFLTVNFYFLKDFSLPYKKILTLKHQDSGQVLGVNEEMVLSNLELDIDKINVKAPIIFDIDGADENKYFKALEKGVAHMKNTSKPGEQGNVIIFGHSSAAIGATGGYNEIFAKLNNLNTNDEIKIKDSKNNKEYRYKVNEKKIVLPTDVDIVNNTKNNQLTLFTCWPIGSDEKRLVIVANEIK